MERNHPSLLTSVFTFKTSTTMLTYDIKNKMGWMTISQTHEGKKVSFKIDIYAGNCLAVFVHESMKEGKKYHTLYTFLGDKQHALNLINNEGNLFFDEVRNINLNLFYKESKTLLDILTKNAGYKVKCFYKEGQK